MGNSLDSDSTRRRPPTQRQVEIIAYVDWHVQTKGYGPTVQEIRHHVGAESSGDITRRINGLHDRGYIRKEAAAWRGLRVTPAGAAILLSRVSRASLSVLHSVAALMERLGCGPSLAEVAEETGLNYWRVRERMGELERAALVVRPLPTWRSVRITDRGQEALARDT